MCRGGISCGCCVSLDTRGSANASARAQRAILIDIFAGSITNRVGVPMSLPSCGNSSRRELGQGRKYFSGINTIRLWLSFDAYAGADAAVQKTVAANFQTALQIADSYHLKVILVLSTTGIACPILAASLTNDRVLNATNPSTAELRPRSRSGLHPFTTNAKN